MGCGVDGAAGVLGLGPPDPVGRSDAERAGRAGCRRGCAVAVPVVCVDFLCAEFMGVEFTP